MRWLGLICFGLFLGAQGACAQTLNFDQPLAVTKVRLPLNHPPVDVVCSATNGFVMEIRYWQKNWSDDGLSSPKLPPGQVVPSCDQEEKILENPPLLVTCSVYRRFVVKGQQFEGDEGDSDGIAIIPRRLGQGALPCDDKPAPGEIFLQPDLSSEWFAGAVGDYVFLGQSDGDLYGGDATNVFRADAPKPIAKINMSYDGREDRLTSVPGGFDLRFTADETAECAVGGPNGAACLTRLERMTGAKIPLAQCLKAEPQNPPQSKNAPLDPVAIEYPALLSVRGVSAALRATGPGIACVASE